MMDGEGVRAGLDCSAPHLYCASSSEPMRCSQVLSIVGSLHESYVHERFKRMLNFAFRKPAMAVVSRHPARTEGL